MCRRVTQKDSGPVDGALLAHRIDRSGGHICVSTTSDSALPRAKSLHDDHACATAGLPTIRQSLVAFVQPRTVLFVDQMCPSTMRRLVKYNARNIRVQSSPSNVPFEQPITNLRALVAYFHWKSQDESLSGPPVVYCYAVDPERRDRSDAAAAHLKAVV